MSARRSYTYTTTGAKDVINLDHLQLPFQASVLVDIVSGTATYSVELTYSDLTGDSSGFRWFSDPALPAGQSQTRNFSIESPVTGCRLNIAAITGTVTITVIQGMGRG